MKIPRRQFLASAAAGLASAGLATRLVTAADQKVPVAPVGERPPPPAGSQPFLTPAGDFEDVSRGTPKPWSLQGEALAQAELTPETWRLEVTADDAVLDYVKEKTSISRPLSLDLPALRELGRKHAVRYIKAMQCLNIPGPLGQGLWEGVPLRDVLRLAGKMMNVRRIYYWGFHNGDPKQIFRSSLSYSQVMETPPEELPVFLAYRLNGEDLTLKRGGPVRMVVPWAHGFKSVKWLQRIVLTNDYKANDTYAEKNNDPESHLKTAAYLNDVAKQVPSGQAVMVTGRAIAGWSGLQRVETWLRPVNGEVAELGEDDPAWESAKWNACQLDGPPGNWSSVLPKGISTKDVLGFDRRTGQPRSWPLRYSMVGWSATLNGLARGRYELRARAVDLNGFAQPEPRSMLKTGRNAIQVRRFEVV